mmetsp:Transcript_69078/g.199999  ORF Transcript_69078/g.199999 Transcript_69078/m.199999 type:complete len:211 (+) Transcript_69078:51-683(+)
MQPRRRSLAVGRGTAHADLLTGCRKSTNTAPLEREVEGGRRGPPRRPEQSRPPPGARRLRAPTTAARRRPAKKKGAAEAGSFGRLRSHATDAPAAPPEKKSWGTPSCSWPTKCAKRPWPMWHAWRQGFVAPNAMCGEGTRSMSPAPWSGRRKTAPSAEETASNSSAAGDKAMCMSPTAEVGATRASPAGIHMAPGAPCSASNKSTLSSPG